jgi:hypothetical protein
MSNRINRIPTWLVAGTLLSVLLPVSAALGQSKRHAEITRGQHAEITVLGGIQYGGAIDDLVLERGLQIGLGSGSFEWGPALMAIAGYRVGPDGLVTLSYSRQRTQFDAKVLFNDGSYQRREISVDVGYAQFGGELEIPMNERVVPFIGLSLGASHFTPRRDGSTNWFFAGAFTGGFKLRITDWLGVRTQMRLLATAIGSESQIFCVSSGGAVCAISADLTGFVQGDLMAGLYVAF